MRATPLCIDRAVATAIERLATKLGLYVLIKSYYLFRLLGWDFSIVIVACMESAGKRNIIRLSQKAADLWFMEINKN
jgi:hypothetical protein